MGDYQLGVGRGEIGWEFLLLASVLAIAFFGGIILVAYLFFRRGRDE
jgi:hypothetical protein